MTRVKSCETGFSECGSRAFRAKKGEAAFALLQLLPSAKIALCSWTPEESQVESCEHQDNADIYCQPFPESVFEEREIYTDNDGCHRHHVKHDNYLSTLHAHLGRDTQITL
jgi:hypothetical protein